MLKEKESVILIHGTRSNAQTWEHQVRALRSLNYEVQALDLPGHGSKKNERFTYAAALETIDAAVKKAASSPILIGVSLGGYLAGAYARTSNDLSGLLLAACATEIKGKPLLPYAFVSQRIANSAGKGPAWQTVSDMLEGMNGTSLLTDLKEVKIPVHLISGAKDPLRFGERSFKARGFSQSIIPKAGHDVHLHAPVAFNREMIKFLTSIKT